MINQKPENPLSRTAARELLMDITEQLDSNTRAMDVFAELISGCNKDVTTENLFYLLDPFIQANMTLVKELYSINQRLV